MLSGVMHHVAQKARENRSYAMLIDVADSVSAEKFILEFFADDRDRQLLRPQTNCPTKKARRLAWLCVGR